MHVDDVTTMREIDCAYGEGGGQLVRTAVALAALTDTGVHLHHMRAGRSKPGLAAQHLTAIRAVGDVCGAHIEGLALGATEIVFRPGALRAGDYEWDVGTAGSITLVLQAVLPAALACDATVHLRIIGGTDVRAAPPLDYFRHVLLRLIARMGADVRLTVRRRGYYPRGGGAVEVEVRPGLSLRALRLETPGALQRITAYAHVSNLPAHIVERMDAAARASLAHWPLTSMPAVLGRDEAIGRGGALALVAEMEHTCLAAAVTAERGVSAEQLGTEAARALRAELESGATLDVHAADQLLIYMALARGTSCFYARESSSHARTTLWLLEQLLGLRYRVIAAGSLVRVELEGCAR